MMKVDYYKCPNCSVKFKTLKVWGAHIQTNHPDLIPEGYSISRYFYFTKTGKTHGSCLTCKKDTLWDEASMKYKRYCEDPECIVKYAAMAKERMIGKYGVIHLLNNPDMQRKMVSNRKISGYYKFADGTELGYVGSYEKKFLVMLDTLMKWSSDNILAPSPHNYYYDYKNANDKENEGYKLYIPDFYIPTLNLEIEIKQTTTTHPKIIAVDKVKELQKDEVLKSNKTVNYIKIVDNDFSNFFELLLDLKESIPTDKDLEDPLVANKNATAIDLDGKEIAIEGCIEHFVINDTSMNIDTSIDETSPYSLLTEPLPTEFGCYDSKGLWNPIVKVNGENYRERCECLIFKDNQIFASILEKGSCRVPGGGTMKDKTIHEQCQCEVEEEAFMLVDHLEYLGSFIKKYPESTTPKWQRDQISESCRWIGQYCHIYVAQYVGKSVKIIPDINKDYDIATNGKFHDIAEIKAILYPEIQDMLMNYMKVKQASDIKCEIVQEGLFDFFKRKVTPLDDIVQSWSYNLFGTNSALFEKFTNPVFQGIKIQNGEIEIHGIKYTTLSNRIISYYGDKSIENLFLKKYNAISYKKYLRKRISKSEIKVDYLYVPEFFALELIDLFETLAKRYHDKSYHTMATQLYKESWVSKADVRQNEVQLLETSPLADLSLTLTQYQIEFIQRYPKLKAYLNLNGYILAFVQGLGKTLTAIGLSVCLKKEHVYIVCPNTLKENWALEIKKYYKKYEEDPILWREEVFICSDKPASFNAEKVRFIITNNESIGKAFPYIIEGDNLMILDESHNFRNLQGKRVAELMELRDRLKCKDLLVMSGTPIKAAPAEIVPALMLIDPSFTLEAAKVYSKAFKLNNSLGTSLVQDRFGKIMYRKEKDELPGLPEKRVSNITVAIKNSEIYVMDYVKGLIVTRFQQLYKDALLENDDLRKKFLSLVNKYSTSTEIDKSKYINWVIKTVNTERSMALHEIDQEFMDTYLDTFVRPNLQNKIDYDILRDLEKKFLRMDLHCMGVAIGEILPKYRRDMFIAMYEENKQMFYDKINNSEKKTIIFSQFRDVVEYIEKDLNNHDIGTVTISGKVVNKDRMNALIEFKENDMIRVMVATSQTLGTGVTLVEANQMFFFGPPWRSTDFEQCSDRIHRIGQTVPVSIYTVLLNTGTTLNLSTRMDSILQWSKEMFESSVTKTEESDWDEIITPVTANESATSISDLLSANFFFDDIRKAYIYISALYNKITKYQYGYLSNDYKVTTDFSKFSTLYQTSTMKDFKKYKAGVSWDYAQYQSTLLKKELIECQNYYIELSNDAHTTHTFTIAKIDNQYMYIESTYTKLKGIYYPVTVEDTLDCILHAMLMDNHFNGKYRIYAYDIPENKYAGRTALEFMVYVKNTGTPIYHVYSSDFTMNKVSKQGLVKEAFSMISDNLIDLFEIVTEADTLDNFIEIPYRDLSNFIQITEYFRYMKPVTIVPIANNTCILKNAVSCKVGEKLKDLNISELANAVLANPDKKFGNVRFNKHISEDDQMLYYDIISITDIPKHTMLQYNATDDMPEFFEDKNI